MSANPNDIQTIAMSPQMRILTGHRARRKQDGRVIPNKFYGQSEKFVKENIVEAKEYYEDIFRTFIGNWFVTKTDGSVVPPLEWQNLE